MLFINFDKKIPLKKQLFLVLFCFNLYSSNSLWTKTTNTIIIEHANFGDITQIEIPDATFLTKNVLVNHDGKNLDIKKQL